MENHFESNFELGDVVKWQSGGLSTTTKQGAIIDVLKAGDSVPVCVEKLKNDGLVFHSRWGGGHPRDHQYYAILVSRLGLRGKKLMPYLYFPIVAMLRKVEG